MLHTLLVSALVAVMVVEVKGHGRLLDPPARSTMWRVGFQNVPVNYNDNELFCGGFPFQWNVNNGKCGVCGDPYGGPYAHEKGGKYYTDVIAKHYKEGQDAVIEVELTASHKGWFEFRVCAPENNEDAVTHACLNKNLLHLTNGGTRYPVTKSGHVFHKIPVHLPAGLTCDFCVLQWKYHTGNSYGVDADGKGCVGCGPQEEFYGCANIAIESSDGSTNPKPKPKPTTTTEGAAENTPPPTVKPWEPKPTPKPNPGPKPTPATSGCRAAEGPWKIHAGLDAWCVANCAVGNCPSSHCICDSGEDSYESSETEEGCRAADGRWKSTPGMDAWCVSNCAAGNCPPSHCVCDRKRELNKRAELKKSRVIALLRELLEDGSKKKK